MHNSVDLERADHSLEKKSRFEASDGKERKIIFDHPL